MLKTLIIGASGYTGAELAAYIQRHPQTELTGLMVSANSADAGKCFSICIRSSGAWWICRWSR